MTGSRFPRLGPLALLVALPACASDSARAEPSFDEQPAWTVGTSPEVRIGAAPDGSDALYSVSAAARLAHGDIVVADGGNRRLDVFDAAGHRVRSIGRRGEGPGEFAHPAWVGVRGDTIMVWDMVQSRLTRFDTAGALLGTDPPLRDLGTFPRVVGQTSDGSLIVIASTSAAWRTGPYRDSLLVVRLHPDGGRDTLAAVPGDEQYGTITGNGRVSESTSLPFGKRTVVAARGDRIVLGTADGPALVAPSAEGGPPDTVATVPTAPIRVTDDDVRTFWNRLVTAGPAPAEPPAGLEYPKTHPPYTDIALAPGGDVWVRLPSRPAEWDAGGRWLVFTPEGHLRGHVLVPGRSRILQIGDGWVLATAFGPDDRQMVVLYTLSPP